MSVLNTGLAKTSAEDYEIDYSCRFDNDDGDYLSKTPAAAGNRRLWTFSCWAKLGGTVLVSGTDGYCALFGSYESSTIRDTLRFKNQQLVFQVMGSGFTTVTKTTDALFRDPSAWYHIVAVWDSENGTAGDRVKIYVNGVQQTLTGDDAAGDEDSTFANDEIHYVGAKTADGSSVDNYWDGYMAEVHFIDGTAKTPADFGKSGTYGEWKPIKYTGSHGTNGFYLDFADSAALGDDESGNTNDFAVTNLDAYDQMLDTPTNNFCVMNPNDMMAPNDTLKILQGNLFLNDCDRCNATMAVSSGKWYWEFRMHHQHHGGQSIGINEIGNNIQVANWANNGNSFDIGHPASGGVTGSMYVDGTGTGGTGAVGSVASGQILGFMVDVDAQTITVHVDDTEIDSSLTDYDYSACDNMETITPNASIPGGRQAIANFGQDSSFAGAETSGSANATDSNGYGDFYYEPPADYLALCTKNLPDVAVTPSEHFNTVLYTGDGSGSGSQAITGVGFQPDFVWLKSRSQNWSHSLINAIVGEDYRLRSQISDAEQDITGQFAFGADGFTVTDGGNSLNNSPNTYVAWNWLANGSGSSNTDGSINTTSTSANVDAGFSISTYTGTGSNATVGHGLSKAPEMVIVKNRDQGDGWLVYHSRNTTAPETDRLLLHTTGATDDSDTYWNDTAPTADVFSIGTAASPSGEAHIAYCFHSVEGYSRFGLYYGNDNDTGPFIPCGFRPAFVMIKGTAASREWNMIDSARNPTNGDYTRYYLYADSGSDESDRTYPIDFLSNGFKINDNQDDINATGASGEYIYMAFAETPFKYANAR